MRLLLEGFENGKLNYPFYTTPSSTDLELFGDNTAIHSSVLPPEFTPPLFGNYCWNPRPLSYIACDAGLILTQYNLNELYLKFRMQWGEYTSITKTLRFQYLNPITHVVVSNAEFYFYFVTSTGTSNVRFRPSSGSSTNQISSDITNKLLTIGNMWHVIEIYLKCSSSSSVSDGAIRLDLDGETLINEPEWRTNSITTQQRYYSFQVDNNYNNYYDDIILDSTSCFDSRSFSGVVGYKPSGQGSENSWNSSSGETKYNSLSDNSNDTYVFTQDNDIKETYGIDSTSTDFMNIASAQIIYFTKYRDIRKKLITLVKINGSEYEYSPMIIGVNNFIDVRSEVIENNPETLTFFTKSEFDDMEVGFKSSL